MKDKINRLAIIPARSGSKRIFEKNIKKFVDRPIINFSINNAIKSKLFSKIHISTDSLKFKKYIENKNKLKIDFIRPKYLANDKTPLINVIRYVTKKIDKENFFDEVWLIYPCAPLIKSYDLINASKKFNSTDKKFPMMSVRKYDAPLEWSMEKKGNFFKPNNLKKMNLDSKKIKPYFYESASFIIYSSTHIKNKKKRYDKFYGYELPREKAIDIDDNSDWKVAEIFYKYNIRNK